MSKFFYSMTVILISLFLAMRAESAIDSTTLNSSSITSNVVLSNTTTYLMKGFNYVKNGGSITIPAGTLILGDFETKGTLIIERGGQIFANGTMYSPIVFSSERPTGTRKAGDWGGVIILGRSGINTVTGVDSAEIEGFGPGLGPIYGGQPRNDADNSGVFRYVRLEFPGINLTGISGNEINGLTMGGVGSGTTIEYVMVSYSGDDSFEWFGGTVNCKYLVAYRGLDDDWDTDNGYRGKVQFGLSVRDTALFDVSTSNSFETDNNANSPSNFNSPRTKPIFSNITSIGPFGNTGWSISPLWGRGVHERRNSLTNIFNSILMGWRVGVRFDGSGVYNAATGDTIQMRNNIYAGNLKLADTAGSTSFSAHSWLQNGSYTNTVYSDVSSVQLNSPYGAYPNISPPGNYVTNWMPSGGSPALSGADFSNPNLSGFDVVSFRGAFGTGNWTAGWAQFNPVNYTLPVPTYFDITVIPEGFYNAGLNNLNSSDTVTVYLRQTSSPYSVVDAAKAVISTTTFTGSFLFEKASTGNYYLEVRHRNHLETWSKSGGTPYTAGGSNSYNFTSAANQAYGNNQVLVGSKYCIYGGDPTQEGTVDAADLAEIDNDAANFGSGYLVTDITGDSIVDAADLAVTDNNAANFISTVTP